MAFNNEFTQVENTWIPAGTSRPNTFTAQNVFKAPSTTVPGFVAQAFGTISAIPTLDPNGIALFQGGEAVAGHVYYSASGATTHVVFRRNNGTYNVPTALASGDIIGSLQWQGRGASTFGTVPAAQIRGIATQAFTEAARGTNLEFYVTATGAITQTLSLTLSSALATFGTPSQSTELQISQAAGNNRFLYWQTAGSARWGWYTNNGAESGSNAGSDLLLARYSDAGGLLAGAVITIVRASGNITMNGGGGKTTFAGNAINIATTQSPATSAAAGTTGDIAWDDTYLYVRISTGWRRIALGGSF
ncbi:hypothetical protein UFOVP423_8 [uncultured Caudovirales phage]|uniref:Uncharacterized protein n=1 Tax=uncultured Caudovirales phage TaxID=2100421 RepID=A0A6J5M5G0_9CAUD|nr:hypothetical protein UFOVP423_8 [uncultured Caudovirales phage]